VEVLGYEVENWGVWEIWLAADRVVNHELPRAGALERQGEHEVIERIRAYFAGATVAFDDVELDLDSATPFQARVAAALRAIPYGETVTYGELAALAGHPNAQRAAGTFCAHNRFPLFVPCHRVVAADGLGSYGSLGLSYKRRLLELEGLVC
jgi:methylated-DNA-[protein]-cysteine S-methyltransferase